MRFFILCGLVLFTGYLFSQSFERIQPKVLEAGIELKFPFAGGMNCPQISQEDLNHDNIADLFIHDRVGGKLSAYIYNDQAVGKYVYSPGYVKYFPRTNHWAVLRDFNNDNIPDLFCSSQDPAVGGMSFYRGSVINDTLHFKQLSFLNSPSAQVLPFYFANGTSANLYVSFDDFPTFEDMDGDGDLDIVSFDSGGGYINYYKNVAKEKGLSLDSLRYELGDQCWGKVFEGLSSLIYLSPDANKCSNGVNGGLQVRHIGSTTLAVDLDKDGDQDLLVGDISYNHVTALINTGTVNKAYVTDQQTNFPSNSTPVDIFDFVASYKADLFNDGKTELIFSPNNASDATEDRNTLQVYESPTGSFDDLQLTQKDFLGNDMIDLGSGSHPAFADIDADGDQDMIVGNFSYFTTVTERTSSLYLYLNTGTSTDPVFTLADSNYLDFKQFPSDINYGYAPAFGDLDNDGDIDLIVGNEQGRLLYAENIAGVGNPFVFAAIKDSFMNITLGTSAAPCIFDLNKDGLSDLIIGRRAGTIYFLPNIGSIGNPQFASDVNAAPNNNFLGKLTTGVPGNPSGYSTPYVFVLDKKIHLLAGSYTGTLHLYNNIEGNLDGKFNEVPLILDGIAEGQQTTPVLTNLNDDNYYELVVGNYCGGVSVYKSPFEIKTTSTTAIQESDILLYPNPVADQLHISLKSQDLMTCELKVYDVLGRETLKKSILLNYDNLDLSTLSNGTYFVNISYGNESVTRKIIKL